MLKPNTSPQSPRIELSNDTFAERKYCQVSAYESETYFTVGDPMAFPIVKMENKNPQNVSFRLDYVDPPSNTAVPRPTASITPNRIFDG